MHHYGSTRGYQAIDGLRTGGDAGRTRRRREFGLTDAQFQSSARLLRDIGPIMTINTTAIKTPEAAIRARGQAQWRRAWADQKEARDPIDARWQRLEADDLDAKAEQLLDPDNCLTAPLEVGRGCELIVETKATPTFAEELCRDTVRDNPDMITARASESRLQLASAAEVLAMTVDLTDTIQARNSLERMLCGQLAALHSLVMKNTATAASFAMKAADPHGCIPMQQRQIASIEAARSTNAAARASEAFQRCMLTVDRHRNGARQTVVVQHVNVAEGGQAVVAGAMKAGGDGAR